MDEFHLIAAIQTAANREAHHTIEFNKYPTTSMQDSEDDNEASQHPIIDSFYQIDGHQYDIILNRRALRTFQYYPSSHCHDLERSMET